MRAQLQLCALLFVMLLATTAGSRAQDVGANGFQVGGYTEALVDVELALPVGGIVDAVEVREGQAVAKGDVLLTLKRQEQALEVERIKTLLDMPGILDLARQKALILKQQYDAAKRLYENGSTISQDEFDASALTLIEAQNNVLLLERENRLDRLALKAARARLAERILTAPADGQIVDIVRIPGEGVQPGEVLVRLVDSKQGRFVGNVAALTGNRMAAGQQVCLFIGDAMLEDTGLAASSVLQDLSLPELQGSYVEAVISFVSPAADVASGLLEVHAVFDNSHSAIRPGRAATMSGSRPDCHEQN